MMKHTTKPGLTKTLNTYTAIVAIFLGRLSMICILVGLVYFVIWYLL